MTKRFMGLVLVTMGLGLILAAVPASAHHAVQTQFDYDKAIELKGAVLTKAQFVNPHSYLYFDVTDSSGKVTSWAFEAIAIGGLKKKGLDANTVKVGGVYTVRGVRSKDGKNNAYLQEIVLPNGEVHRVWFGDPNGL